LIQHYAAEGIRSLSHALLEIKQDPESLSVRTSAQYGAWLCAMCLGSTKMGLHHKMCHAIGGALSLSHAETHTVVLPRALAYNAPAVPTALRIIGEALPFGDGDAVRGLHMLVEELGLPNGLHQIGMKESDVSVIVEQMMASGFENPVPLELEKVERLTRACLSCLGSCWESSLVIVRETRARKVRLTGKPEHTSTSPAKHFTELHGTCKKWQ
jgi:alcohol dehydrogenase class IV